MSNERVTGGKYRVDGAPNASYDVHFFLKSVLKCLVHRFGARSARVRDTLAFLAGLGLREEDRQNAEIRGLDPVSVLRNPYFAPLAAATAAAAPGQYDFSYSY